MGSPEPDGLVVHRTSSVGSRQGCSGCDTTISHVSRYSIRPLPRCSRSLKRGPWGQPRGQCGGLPEHRSTSPAFTLCYFPHQHGRRWPRLALWWMPFLQRDPQFRRDRMPSYRTYARELSIYCYPLIPILGLQWCRAAQISRPGKPPSPIFKAPTDILRTY